MSILERAGRRLWLVATLLATVHCTAPVEPPRPVADRLDEWRAQFTISHSGAGWIANAMQPTAAPCDDFYQYACGRWRPALSPAGLGLAQPFAYAELELWRLLEETQRRGEINDRLRSPAALYASCADRDAMRARRLSPLVEFLGPVKAVTGRETMMAALGYLHRHQVAVLFTPQVVPRLTPPPRYAIELSFQSALGLLPPQLYTNDTPIARAVREQYRKRVGHEVDILARELGEDAHVDAFLDLETKLAGHAPATSKVVPTAVTVARMEELTGLPWRPYLQALGVPEQADLQVAPVEYFQFLGEQLNGVDPAVVRSYLQWRTFDAVRSLVSSARLFELAFMSWSGCVEGTQSIFGGALWAEYAQQRGGDERRRRAADIWVATRSAFARQLRGAASLAAEGETLARKVDAIVPFIGFPAEVEWEPSYTLASRTYFENVMLGRQAWVEHFIGFVGQPVDAARCMATPSLAVPAYLSRMNSVVIPMWVLQPPIFDPGFSPVLNFASLGSIMAHEVGHALGRGSLMFEPNGQLIGHDTRATSVLASRGECLARHYNRFEASPAFYSRLSASVLPSLPVDPERTFDENLADVLGVRAAFAAYKLAATHGGPEVAVQPTLTNDQLFFVAFAQNWCGAFDPHVGRFLAEADVHTPSRARVNAALSALPEFAETFQCGQGSLMNPADRCELL